MEIFFIPEGSIPPSRSHDGARRPPVIEPTRPGRKLLSADQTREDRSS